MKLSDGNNRTIRFPGFDQFACGERQTANQNVISIKNRKQNKSIQQYLCILMVLFSSLK